MSPHRFLSIFVTSAALASSLTVVAAAPVYANGVSLASAASHDDYSSTIKPGQVAVEPTWYSSDKPGCLSATPYFNECPADGLDTLTVDGQGEWKIVTVYTSNGKGKASSTAQWIVFTPAEGFVGTSTVNLLTHRDGAEHISRLNVTVDPKHTGWKLLQYIVADDDWVLAPKNTLTVDLLANDTTPEGAVSVHMIDPQVELTDKLTINGAQCVINGPQLKCDLTSSTGPFELNYLATDVYGNKSNAGTVSVVRKASDPIISCYDDVTINNTFLTEIDWACKTGMSKGWQNPPSERTLFKPGEPVQRAAAAAFLYRMAGEPEFTAPKTSPFKDVNTSHPLFKEIAWAVSEDITKGWDDGTFRPHLDINRDALIAFMARFEKAQVSKPKNQQFTDVAVNDPLAPYIYWAKDNGITKGWDDGTFRPRAKVDREATVAFLYRLCSSSERCGM